MNRRTATALLPSASLARRARRTRALAVACGAVASCTAWAEPAPSAPPAPPPAASAASAAQAQRQQEARTVSASPLGVCFRRTPAYPVVALRNEWTGRTLLGFTVTATGVLQEPGVVRSSGHAVLDQAALAHLAQCIAEFPPDHQPPLPAGRFVLPMVWRIE